MKSNQQVELDQQAHSLDTDCNFALWLNREDNSSQFHHIDRSIRPVASNKGSSQTGVVLVGFAVDRYNLQERQALQPSPVKATKSLLGQQERRASSCNTHRV
jgi:hypothetical protein